MDDQELIYQEKQAERCKYLAKLNREKLVRVKRDLDQAKQDRAKCQQVFDESNIRDGRLLPALDLFDKYIRDLVNETDCLANNIRGHENQEMVHIENINLLTA